MSLHKGKDDLDSGGRIGFTHKKENPSNRWKLIIINIALGLVIVIIALTVKAVVLDRKPDKNQGKNLTDPVAATAAPVDTPAAVEVPEPQGAEKWLRKDLDPNKPMVALTFDDGPYSKVTRKILKTLKKTDSRATFFVVGNRVEDFAETLKMTYDQGNQIASHTYDHADLSKMSAKQIKKEIDKTNKEVSKVIGCDTTALRPPYGNVSQKMRKTVPVPMFYWSLDSEDWKSRNVDSILKKCKSVEDGDIILMHDLYPTTAKAAEKLVPKLVKKGFQLVTIDELMYYKGIKGKAGKVYYSGR
ncbi:MAG: polysaccharide deacetylase family protein [Lachnospiraceae bacterium]|nr:polysaccharide deacetylase family protein [Lachnospiraceae bacterium]